VSDVTESDDESSLDEELDEDEDDDDEESDEEELDDESDDDEDEELIFFADGFGSDDRDRGTGGFLKATGTSIGRLLLLLSAVWSEASVSLRSLRRVFTDDSVSESELLLLPLLLLELLLELEARLFSY
jgi:hypothetical protein